MVLKRKMKAGLLFLYKNTISVTTPSVQQERFSNSGFCSLTLKQFYLLCPPSPLSFHFERQDSVLGARDLGFSSEGEQ